MYCKDEVLQTLGDEMSGHSSEGEGGAHHQGSIRVGWYRIILPGREQCVRALVASPACLSPLSFFAVARTFLFIL